MRPWFSKDVKVGRTELGPKVALLKFRRKSLDGP